MKRSDLFREYARVIDMCEGTGVHPFSCVRVNGKEYVSGLGIPPTFSQNPADYAFALAIVEDKSVFKGDEIYFRDGATFAWGGDDNVADYIQDLTWPKPRTFTLNGEVLPCPREKKNVNWSFTVGSRVFYFDTHKERNQTMKAILKMLTDAENS